MKLELQALATGLNTRINTMKPPHTFCVSRSTDATWSQGLRNFFEYRELGINEATNGQYNAQILRVKNPAPEFPHTAQHTHDLDFQMFYVLKGWIRFTYEGHGEFTFRPGDSCLQPPGIVHDEIACSDDLELIQFTSPAKYATHAVPSPNREEEKPI